MRALVLIILLALPVAGTAEEKEYLYSRDVNVPAYQTLREFFDLPNRPGKYEITLVSEAVGPLTFRILRVQDDRETPIKQFRSYRIREHEFQTPFPNPKGAYDLIVEIANSNPAAKATVSVFVVELP